MPAGDDLKDEKVALIVLCKALSRKGNDNAILYIYQECKVKYLSQYLRCCLITSIPGLPHFVQYDTRKMGKAWEHLSLDVIHEWTWGGRRGGSA